MACFRHLWAPRHVNPRIQVIKNIWIILGINQGEINEKGNRS